MLIFTLSIVFLVAVVKFQFGINPGFQIYLNIL